MKCGQCETVGTGSAIYLHEKRSHGLTQGVRVLTALRRRHQAYLANGAADAREDGPDAEMQAPDRRQGVDFGDSSDEDEMPGASILAVGQDVGQVADEARDEEDEGDDEDGADVCGAPSVDPGTRREIEDAVEKELCDFLAELEIIKGVPGITVDLVVKSMQMLASYGENRDPCGNPLRTVLSRLKVDTAKQRTRMYEGKLGPPTGTVMGIPAARSSKDAMYHKPISEHLKELVQCEEVVQGITGRSESVFVPWYVHHEDFVHDFKSAERFQAIYEHLGEAFIPVRVYGDGFSPNNIGPHRLDAGEVYGIYCQVMTYPPHLSRNLDAWMTVTLCDTTGGASCRQLWAPVIDDIELLQERGVYVPALERTVPVVLISYCGDLKDQNLVCSMAACGAKYPHATNLVSSDDRKSCLSFDDVNPLAKWRNRRDHNRDIEVYRATKSAIRSRGAKGSSPFDRVADFIEHRGFLTVDTAHSYYLGVVKSDLTLTLSLFMFLGIITEEEIDNRMTTFKEKLQCEERSSFVVNLFGGVVGFRLSLKGSISQSRMLVKYSTLIFADLAETAADEGGPVLEAWNLILELHKVFTFVESYCLSKRQLEDYQQQLERYINQRIKVRDSFEDLTEDRVELLPKHVDMLTAVHDFKALGSLMLSSTTSMESKNGQHKEAIRRTKNRINTMKTAAVRAERWEKYRMGKLFRNPEIVPKSVGRAKICMGFTHGQVKKINEICGRDFALNLLVHGNLLRSGYVIERYVSEDCEETECVKLLGAKCNDPESISLLVENFDSVYLENLDCYGARNLRGDVSVMVGESLCVPTAFAPIKMESLAYDFVFTKSMIVPKK